jgi:transposase
MALLNLNNKSMSNFEKINPHAAGIDLGSEQIFVSVDGETVCSFGTFTPDVQELKQYLLESKVDTVMMEATGVLWVPVYDVLESAGIQVCLVNAAHAKNIPAQKSDPADCRWLYKLHVHGLVRASFIPEDAIRELRSYVRLREDNKDIAASHIQHIQKAFELMNIKLHNVISDTMSASGISIIEAILAGERSAATLTALCHKQILKHKKENVEKSLNGNFRRDYVFMLQQAYDAWVFYQKQIDNCNKKIAELLCEMTKTLPVPPQQNIGKSNPSRHDNLNIEDLHKQLVTLNKGNDATKLPGFSDSTVLKLVAELGTDFSKWPSEKHFVSWIGLSPRKYQSGKTNKTRRSQKKNTKAGQIFKESAMSIAASKYLALKGFYNRIKSKHGAKSANKATARKLAVLFYLYMTKGFDYVETGLQEYEKRFREIVLKGLAKKAHGLGYQLVASDVH